MSGDKPGVKKPLFLLLLGTAIAGAQTAQFPGAIVTDSQLGVAANNIQTTLTQFAGSTATTFNVASTTQLAANMLLSLDGAEIVHVCSVNTGAGTFSVGVSSCPNVDGRGFDSTTAVTHNAGASVTANIDAWHHNAMKAEMEAVQTALGINLGNIPGTTAGPSVPLNKLAGISGAQGNGAKLQLGTGSAISGDFTQYDSSGNVIDSGVPASAIPLNKLAGITGAQGNGAKLQLATGSPVAGDFTQYDSSGNVIDSGVPATGIGSGYVLFTSGAIGGKAATTAAGTVTVSGTAVTGSGTSFTSLFNPNDPIVICDGPCKPVYVGNHAGTGYLTSQPVGQGGPKSLVTLFGGGTTTGLNSGDTICVPVYGGNYATGALANVGQCWTVDSIIDSTHLLTTGFMYPEVGSGQYACTIWNNGTTADITCNTPHGLTTGTNTTIANTGSSALNGVHSITNQPQPFVLDPTTATSLTISTSGVSNGWYVSNSITLSGVTPGNHVTCSITSNVATCTFLQWPGFTQGDSFNIAGASTGTCSNLNGTHTVTSVGSGDYPKTITFSAPSVSNGTCNDTTMLFGTSWSYSQRPQRLVVSTVNSNTSITLVSAPTVNFPAGSTAIKAPDNTAAMAAACSAGQSIFVPDGDYYVHVVDASYHNPSCSNYSAEWRMAGNARYVLDDITKNGFYFLGGTRAIYANWTVDYLSVPNFGIGGAPGFAFALALEDTYQPKVLNFRCGSSLDSCLQMEYNDHPRVDGIETWNTGNPLLLNANIDPIVTGFSATNTHDEVMPFYWQPQTCPNCIDAQRGGVLSNFYLKNTGWISLQSLQDISISNGVMEGPYSMGIYMGANNPGSKYQLSNIEIRGAGMAGPHQVWFGGDAVVHLYGQTLVDLNTVKIIAPQGPLGGVLAWGASPQTTLRVSNMTVSGASYYGVQSYALRAEIYNSYFENLGDSCLALYGTYALVNGATCMNVAQKWGGGTGSSFGANNAFVLNGLTDFAFTNVHLIDNQGTATGYKFDELSPTTTGYLANFTTAISDASHQLTYSIANPGNVHCAFGTCFPPLGTTFSNLGTPVNGTVYYCPDCTIASTCAGSGTGAVAKRLNSTWVCN